MAEDIEIRIEKILKNQVEPDADIGVVDELVLFGMNDEPLYRQFIAFTENYNRKRAKNTYDNTLAIKGLANNLVPAIVKKYRDEFGLDRVSRDTKIMTAIELMYIMENEYFDELR